MDTNPPKYLICMYEILSIFQHFMDSCKHALNSLHISQLFSHNDSSPITKICCVFKVPAECREENMSKVQQPEKGCGWLYENKSLHWGKWQIKKQNYRNGSVKEKHREERKIQINKKYWKTIVVKIRLAAIDQSFKVATSQVLQRVIKQKYTVNWKKKKMMKTKGQLKATFFFHFW